jgi:uncharacterized protein involved in exopolysaccharide biosynthesis
MMITRASANGPSVPSTRDVFRVLARQKRKMVVFFCATLSAIVGVLIVFPRTYSSEARLFVRLGKESVSLDPTATLGQTVTVNESRESEINSELEMLRSRVLLEDVVEHLGPERILSGSTAGESSWLGTLFSPVSMVSSLMTSSVSDSERAVTKLEKMIVVGSPRKSNVIVLTCNGRDPKQAQAVLQDFLDSYMVRHGKANRTSGSHDFFVEQSELLRQQLERATHELRDVKNSSRFVSIEGQRANVQAQVDSIESAMLENQRHLAASEAKIAALTKALGELPPQLTAEESVVPNLGADTMRNELYKLQILEKEASSRNTSEHPRVIALRRQVAETQRILDEQEPNRNHVTRKLSVVHQAAQTELMTAQALAAAQKAEGKSLEEQYASVMSKLRTLNDNESHITHLNRQVALLETSYGSYATNREQARIDAALEAGRISNVNVVQPASFVGKPTNPKMAISLLAGFFVASVGAVLLAFGVEYFDRSLKTPQQIEQELGIPVLLAVPRGTRHELLKN